MPFLSLSLFLSLSPSLSLTHSLTRTARACVHKQLEIYFNIWISRVKERKMVPYMLLTAWGKETICWAVMNAIFWKCHSSSADMPASNWCIIQQFAERVRVWVNKNSVLAEFLSVKSQICWSVYLTNKPTNNNKKHKNFGTPSHN